MSANKHAKQAAAAAAEEALQGRGKVDLLLRFFDSDFFDEWIAVSYLWRTRAEGVRDYLCNRMYTLNAAGVELYLAQLVIMATSRPSAALDRLVIDFCLRSLRLSCKVSWWLSAYENDGRTTPEALAALRKKCEEAALRGKWPPFKAEQLLPPGSGPQPVAVEPETPAQLAECRRKTFEGSMDLVRQLCEASTTLAKTFPVEDRLGTLRKLLARLSAELESRPSTHALWWPLGRETARICRIPAEEAVLMNSRDRAPFLLLAEVILPEAEAEAGAAAPVAVDVDEVSKELDQALAKVVDGGRVVRLTLTLREEGHVAVRLEPVRTKQPHQRVPSDAGLAEMAAVIGQASASSSNILPAAPRAAGPFGEKWPDKVARVRASSPYGGHARWALRAVIVKSGDDCRQEHMAVQLISCLHSIFAEAGLPVWLRPFEVLVTSSNSAFIEAISNAPSIHSVKSRAPRGATLRDTFIARYGANTAAFRLAQRNFVESMAGYSILSFLFQLRDRHNGNLLLDDDGHIIHIDFGYMLSHSPGGINFESAPFKLTRELLEVMDSDAEGTASDAFNYFKVLCIQSYLAARKHAERIMLMVEMMQGSGCPCFKGGPKVMQGLRKRFHLGSTEEQCVEVVLSLISDSLDAWSTRHYDAFQKLTNGIL